MRGLTYIVCFISIFVMLSACAVVIEQSARTNTHTVGNTEVTQARMDSFDYIVAGWSSDLKTTPYPSNSSGNCLPVVVELQKRIVRTGRMAIIVVTNPNPENRILHAMLMYGHEKGGRFSRIIDNGYLTDNYPKPAKDLYTGEFGEYIGVCKTPHGGRCAVSEPF